MGDVVRLRPEPVVDAQRVLWVETMCLFADAPEKAARYIAHNTSRRQIIAELWATFYGNRSPSSAAAYVRHLAGPHRPDRRPLPIHPATYGIRRPA